jgi:hypothetical protein
MLELQTSLSIAKDIAARDPGNTNWQTELCIVYEILGDVRFNMGQREAALNDYRAAALILQKLVSRDASNADWVESARKLQEKIATLEKP